MSETKGKKLIEVALPLDKINEACVREKSIRHGHPSTLHLWWARRPLAAARAVIWASLVDDPSSHPEQFPTETAQEKERNRLFKILEKLVVWENSCDEQVLHAAKEEIMKSTGGNPPALLDPFCGGGAIPLEAQRLGLKAYASDLNPIPVMINKAMIEIPPLFQDQKPVHPGSSQLNVYQGNAGLAEDVEYYANWMRDEAYKRIGYLYPKATIRNGGGGEEKATVIAWIWARTVKCPNPACQSEIPLVHSFNLSKKKGHECHIHLDIDHSTHPASITYTIESGLVEGTKEGTVSRQGAVCPVCGEPIDFPYLREEGKQHHLGATLMAIVADGPNGRIYLPATEEHVQASECERPEEAPDGPLPVNPRNFNTPIYGLDHYANLFTSRQLVALTTFSALVQEAQQKAEQDALAAGRGDDGISLEKLGKGAKAYGQAIGVYLACIVDKATNLWTSLASWMNDRGAFRETFSRQAIPMVWDYAEANPFSDAGGNFLQFSKRVSDVIKDFPSTTNCQAVQWDATQDINLRNIMVSTDPPYYDNIAYADLSDFFYVWMRQSLRTTYPDLFATMLTPKTPELIASPYRFDGSKVKAKQHFEDGMLQTCRNIFQYARPDIPVTIYYAFKQSDAQETDGTASSGWETMLSAIIKAGFVITGTWPLKTESTGRAISQGANALASSIVIVCRKPDGARPDILRKDFVDILHGELKDALTKLQSSNIAPVDLAQSIIGPGIAVYSRYRKVLAADGSAISVRDALKMINAVYAEILKVTSFGPEADFCLILYEQNGFNDMRFGEADVLARSKNTAVDKMAKEGLVDSAKGIVRLKTREELSAFSPHSENLWLITQQVVQACEKNGYAGTAAIFSQLNGAQTDQVKKMCYRLYKIADSKGWSKDGQAYNAVIAGWDAMAHEAAQLKQQKNQAVQGTLGF